MNRLLVIILHSMCAIIFFASFAWLAYENMVPSGAVTYVQNFKERTPFVSDFWPPERMDPIVKIGEYAVRPVVESPVSFFIYPPRVFQTSTIAITYKLKEPALFEVGIETGEKADEIKMNSWESLESLGGDYWRGTITVPMSTWWRDRNYRYHAELSVDELLDRENELLVREISVSLAGKPDGIRAWWNSFK